MANDNQDIIKIVQTFLPTYLDVSLEDSLTEDLELSQMEIIELSMDLEREFGIFIPDEEIQRWHTISDVVNCIAFLI